MSISAEDDEQKEAEMRIRGLEDDEEEDEEKGRPCTRSGGVG